MSKEKIVGDGIEVESGMVSNAAKGLGVLRTIPLTVVNSSSHDIQQGGTWAVKDESVTPPVVQTATFGPISRGASETQNVSLPHGFTWGIYRFEPVDNSGSWTGVHGGNGATSGKLTLSD